MFQPFWNDDSLVIWSRAYFQEIHPSPHPPPPPLILKSPPFILRKYKITILSSYMTHKYMSSVHDFPLLMSFQQNKSDIGYPWQYWLNTAQRPIIEYLYSKWGTFKTAIIYVITYTDIHINYGFHVYISTIWLVYWYVNTLRLITGLAFCNQKNRLELASLLSNCTKKIKKNHDCSSPYFMTLSIYFLFCFLSSQKCIQELNFTMKYAKYFRIHPTFFLKNTHLNFFVIKIA